MMAASGNQEASEAKPFSETSDLLAATERALAEGERQPDIVLAIVVSAIDNRPLPANLVPTPAEQSFADAIVRAVRKLKPKSAPPPTPLPSSGYVVMAQILREGGGPIPLGRSRWLAGV